jgi:hypothetical protein
MNEASWNRLLDKIRENNVVPIVGCRLLVGAHGHSSLQEQIARRLLEDCEKPTDVPLPRFRELNEAVSMLRGSKNTQELYDYVHDAIRSVLRPPEPAERPPIPKAIQHLAQISEFRLYVTLTPDDLLAQALRERYAVNEIIHSPNLPTSEGRDLPSDWKTQAAEVYLLYLFGKSRSAPMFAIHDEDLLEYAHNVIAQGSQVPTAFLGELQQRNLLLIGCNFPDWLARFVLRSFTQRRLSEKDRRAWMIEPLQPDENLTIFLQRYGKEIEVLSQDPPEVFVAELHERWVAAHGPGAQDGPVEEKSPPRGAMFFISYSRPTDGLQASSMYEALLKQGVTEAEIWIDRGKIDPGANYERKILDGIHSCRYFLPLISRGVNAREQGFVFREWQAACNRFPSMNREFVLPVIVDPDYDPEIYKPDPVLKWKDWKIDFGHAPGGVPDGRLEAKLKALIRDARRPGEQS